jgi:hypothetical protein
MVLPDRPARTLASQRHEAVACERSTPGCCIDHTVEQAQYGQDARNLGCETW